MTLVVPFNNLRHRVDRHRVALDAAYGAVADSGWLVLGEHVANFETAFAEFVGVEACVGVANGTDAIELALRGTGSGPGSVVATAANAGGYAASAIRSIGATPVFVDVDPTTHTVTVDSLTPALEAGVDALVVTHLYGQLAPDIAAIADLCLEHNVVLVEDCAQAHGAQRDGRTAGSFGAAAAFSFYPTKNLGALGDGGAVCGGSEVAARVRSLRQYGWSAKYTTDSVGGRNSRLDELQAAFLLAMLPSLVAENAERVAIANRYLADITSSHVELPTIAAPQHVAHLFVMQTDHRDELREYLSSHGVSTDVHYPIPDHQQSVVAENATVSLPVTEELARRSVSLPCYPGLDIQAIDHVIACINDFDPDGAGT